MNSEHFWNVASFLVSRGTTLVLFAIVVSYFVNASSASAFADVSLLLLMFSYIQLLDLGIGYAITQRLGRSIALGTGVGTDIIRAALPMYLGCACVASFLLFLLSDSIAFLLFKSATHAEAIKWLAAGLWALFLSALMNAVMQAHNKVVWINVSRTLLEVVKAIGFVIAAEAEEPVRVVIIVTIIGVYVRLALDVYLGTRLMGGLGVLRPAISTTEMKRILTMGWPMIVALVLGIVNTFIDRVYVSRVLGSEALAVYTISYEVNSKAFFLVGAVSGALYTPILRRAAVGQSQAALLWTSIASVAVVTLGYFIPLAAFAEPILSLWINPEIGADASLATKVGSMMGVSYLAMSVVFNLLQASGRPIAVMMGTFVASTVILSGLSLMPLEWGAEGALAIVAAGFFAQFVYYVAALASQKTS